MKQAKLHKLPRIYRKNGKKCQNFQNFALMMFSIDITVVMETD